MKTALRGLKEEEQGRLKKLGFKRVVEKDEEVKNLQRKLAIAYEHFRYVRQEKIAAFNQKLFKKTHSKDGSYDVLTFESICTTSKVPPVDVLTELEKAKELNCFDEFEIGYIAKVEDPILFGVVNGCTTKFYIAQWDTDICIEDILADNEG